MSIEDNLISIRLNLKIRYFKKNYIINVKNIIRKGEYEKEKNNSTDENNEHWRCGKKFNRFIEFI